MTLTTTNKKKKRKRRSYQSPVVMTVEMTNNEFQCQDLKQKCSAYDPKAKKTEKEKEEDLD